MATVTLTRTGVSGLIRKLKVLVDGQKVGSLGLGATMSFALTPGSHAISVKMDWARSAPLVVTPIDDETILIEAVVPNPIVLMFRMFHPDRLFHLRLIETRE